MLQKYLIFNVIHGGFLINFRPHKIVMYIETLQFKKMKIIIIEILNY